MRWLPTSVLVNDYIYERIRKKEGNKFFGFFKEWVMRPYGLPLRYRLGETPLIRE